MLVHTDERRLPESMAEVFGALLLAVAPGRWNNDLAGENTRAQAPRMGCRYSAQRRGRLCRGEVLECLRPVSLVIRESLHRSPSCVDLRLQWRLQPVDGGTIVRYQVSAVLNRAANIKRANWQKKLRRDSDRMLAIMCRVLQDRQRDQSATGSIGQTRGNNNIVTTKIKAVSGKPIFK